MAQFENYSVLPVKEMVLFPGTVSPLLVGRESSLRAIEYALEKNQGKLVLLLQKNPDVTLPKSKDLANVGVLAQVVSQSHLPGGMFKVLVESFMVVQVELWTHSEDSDDLTLLSADVSIREEDILNYAPDTHFYQSLMTLFKRWAESRDPYPKDLVVAMEAAPDLASLVWGLIPLIDMNLSAKQSILEANSLVEIWDIVSQTFKTLLEVDVVRRRSDHEVRQRMQNNQREYYLNEQIRILTEELEQMTGSGGPQSELREIEQFLQRDDLPKDIVAKGRAELNKMSYVQPGSPEYGVTRAYLETISQIPFGIYSVDNTDIRKVQKALEVNHYGLKKAKERIVEFVAVLARKKFAHSTVLCLIGPPGVGKTSLVKSIAEALGREYYRLALGGIRDEAEIRGHRKTYIGAMPGRFVEALRKTKVMNPLILLDEIDKMTSDFRGDPAGAMLEVLDPEQNHSFRDHYLEAEIDLSQALFICTANSEEAIPEVLKDRMDVIRLPGYHFYEKSAIAKEHLLPRVLKKNGLTVEDEFELTDDAIEVLLKKYTREAGVRQLEREIDRLARKRVVQIGTRKKWEKVITGEDVPTYLGVPPYSPENRPTVLRPGIVTGLAWTSVGGEVLMIEVTLLPGKGRFKITGRLGDVMKESVQIAYTLVQERAEVLKINPKIFGHSDLHIHFPEGAIPKDGPSAGIGITMALISAYTGKILPYDYAFTGEVSLSGAVHAIGGLQEKTIAALNAGVKEVLLPEENRKDISELPAEVKKGLKISTYKSIDEVIKYLWKKMKTYEDHKAIVIPSKEAPAAAAEVED